MNDPGLDEPISNGAKGVENQAMDERDEREEDEQAYLEPRYVSNCESYQQYHILDASKPRILESPMLPTNRR